VVTILDMGPSCMNPGAICSALVSLGEGEDEGESVTMSAKGTKSCSKCTLSVNMLTVRYSCALLATSLQTIFTI